VVDEMTEPMTARERVIARYGWPLPVMAGAEEPAGADDGGSGGDAGGDGGQGAGDAGGAAGGAAADTSSGSGDQPKPPWGSDEDFKPDTAWRLIQNLRGDVEKLKATKAERDDLAAKVKEYEDAGKSDAERRDEQLASTTKERDSLKNENARLRVALDLGLTASQAKRLVGETEDELRADAEELLKDFGGSKKDAGSGKRQRPKEDLKPGSVPGAEPEDTDPASLAKQVPAGW